MTGNDVWPFTTLKSARLVRALGQAMSTVPQRNITVQNAVQARRRRRTLLVSSSSDVYVELDGDSYNTTDSIKADLTNAVNNGGLATTLQSNKLPVTAISLASITTVMPTAADSDCTYGSVAGSCISETEAPSTLSTGAIIGIVIGVGAFGLGVGFMFLWYCWLRTRCCNGGGSKETNAEVAKKPMTPMAALPFWLKGKNAQENGGEINMTAAPAGIDAVHPHAPGPQFMVDRDADGNEVPHAGIPAAQAAPTEDDLRAQHHAEYVEMGGRQARDSLAMGFPKFESTGKKLSKQRSGLPRTTSGSEGTPAVPHSAVSSPYSTYA